MNPNYVDTVRLLLVIAPTVFTSGRFAAGMVPLPAATLHVWPHGCASTRRS